MAISLAITGAQIVDIIAVTAFVAAGIYAWRLRVGPFPRILRLLEQKGHVIDKRVQRQNDRKVTLIWGRLPHPVNLRFQIVEAKLLDQSKRFADSDAAKTGDAEFDERFSVLMDLPHLAPVILDEATRANLLKLEEANFATGSIASLHPPEYWPEVEGAERGVLQLWAMHLDRGKISENEAQPWIELSKALAEKVAEVAKANGLLPQ